MDGFYVAKLQKYANGPKNDIDENDDNDDEEEDGGEDDDDEEDTSQKCYSIFVHKNSGTKKFSFPLHESAFDIIVHRGGEEVYFRAWYDNSENSLSLNDTHEAISESEISPEEIDEVIVNLYLRYS
jgi:hypothetical protein